MAWVAHGRAVGAMLIGLARTFWKPLAALALAAAIFMAGWRHGAGRVEARIEAERAQLQQRLAQVADDLSEAAAELENEKAARAALAEELEHEAASDPGAALRRPSADSLRRLERRWSD